MHTLMKHIRFARFNVLLFLACALFSASPLPGASAFFSTKGFGEGASQGNPEVFVNQAAANVDLHVYFVPDSVDARYLGISFDVTSATAGIADLVTFSVLNPDILMGAIDVDDRWNSTGGSINSTELLTNFTGVSIDKAGLDPTNDGSGSFLDAGYDSTAAAYYFGNVTFDPVGLGSTDLSLSVGPIGIARAGDKPQPVGPTASLQFGAPEPATVSGDDIGATGEIFDARINVIPEPSATLLVVAGLFLSCLLRRK